MSLTFVNSQYSGSTTSPPSQLALIEDATFANAASASFDLDQRRGFDLVSMLHDGTNYIFVYKKDSGHKRRY
jgi:hypothetical protein